MTELRPLLESSDDELERALLASVGAELPGRSGLQDTALALGLSVPTASALAAALPALGSPGVGLHAASVAGSSAGAVVGSSTGAAVAVGSASLGLLGKSLLGGALLSFLALTTLDRTLTPSHPRTEAARTPSSVGRAALASKPAGTERALSGSSDATSANEPAPAPAAAPASAPVTRRVSSALSEPAAVEVAPPANHAPARAAFGLETRAPSGPGATPANASLAAEIRALDQARLALAAGDTRRASALLDAYAAGRPSPVLSQEAALLRVQLLLKRGERASAIALARQIIAQHPESAHVDSLRRLAAEP